MYSHSASERVFPIESTRLKHFSLSDIHEVPRSMGILSHSDFEKFLSQNGLASEAFIPVLPDWFRASLIVRDLTTDMHRGFISTHHHTAFDVVNYCKSKVKQVMGREVDDTEEVEELIERVRNGDVELIKDLREDRNCQVFRTKTCDNATIVLCKDDFRYMPSIREIVNDKRKQRVEPYGDAEFNSKPNAFFFGERPIPASAGQDGLSDICWSSFIDKARKRAYGTPCIKYAVSQYVPWALLWKLMGGSRKLCSRCLPQASPETEEIKAQFEEHERLLDGDEHIRRYKNHETREGDGKSRSALEQYSEQMIDTMEGNLGGYYTDFGQNGNTLCICNDRQRRGATNLKYAIVDQVNINLSPMKYASTPVHELERTPQKSKSFEVELDTGRVTRCGAPPPVGEADLKIIHYIEHFSEEGDHVLVVSPDSDVVWVLLLNMTRFTCRDGSFSREIFLDANLPNMAVDRHMRRFVHINALYKAIVFYATKRWDITDLRHAVYAFAAAALSLGGDYTERLSGIGPRKIIDALTSSHMINVMKQAFTTRFIHRNVILVMNDAFTRSFTIELMYQKSIKKNKTKLDNTGSMNRYVWDHTVNTLNEGVAVDKIHRAADFEFARAYWRRIAWNINYMMLGGIGLGCIPDPLAKDPRGTPIWGWSLANDGKTIQQCNRVSTDIAFILDSVLTEEMLQ